MNLPDAAYAAPLMLLRKSRMLVGAAVPCTGRTRTPHLTGMLAAVASIFQPCPLPTSNTPEYCCAPFAAAVLLTPTDAATVAAVPTPAEFTVSVLDRLRLGPESA